MPRMAYNPHTSVEVDLSALERNYRLIRKALAPSTQIVAVVKADAYGHGAVPVARRLRELGAAMLGVANVAEGVELREGGVKIPILLLGGFQPGEEREVLAYDLSPMLYRWDGMESLASEASRDGKRVKVHLKVDTGMGRLGVPWKEAPQFMERLRQLPSLVVEGVASHLATADEDPEYAREQLQRLLWVVREVSKGQSKPLLHIANSAAVFTLPEAHLDLVRPGIALYGAHPSASFKALHPLPLEPIMTWKSKIADLKEHPPSSSISYGRTFVTSVPSRIAAVPVGYADGYPRCLSNKAQVLVRGRRAPVVGRVTMDWIMVDVTSIPDAEVGDEVILLGGGEGGISAEELSSWAETIPYEILCSAGMRSKRLYKG